MSLKTTRKLPAFEGVAAGSTATLRCPIGLTYHKILITAGNVGAGPGPTLAQINGIRVILNGRELIRYRSGAELDLLNQFQGMAAFPGAGAAGVLTIDFDRYNLKTRAAEEVTALGTGVPFGNGNGFDSNPLTTLTVEVDIDAAATSPSLSAVAIQSTPQPLGLIKKVLTFNYGPTGAGEYEIDDLPKGDIINTVFAQNSASTLNFLRIERDNFVVFDRTDLVNDTEQTNGVRVPQANLYVYDPTEAGNGAEGLVTANVNDLRFIYDVGAAMNLLLNVEYLGGLRS